MPNSKVPFRIRTRTWWVRKLRISHLIAAATLALGIVAFVLGVIGFQSKTGGSEGGFESIYRSLQMFVGTFPDLEADLGFTDILAWARVLAISSTLIVTITTVTALLRFPADDLLGNWARNHVVLIGDLPELDELATRIVLPHLDEAGSKREDGAERIMAEWPCGPRRPVIRVSERIASENLQPGIRRIRMNDIAAMGRAVKGASRVVVACSAPGDTIRTVRHVMGSEPANGASVHVLAGSELRGPLEAAATLRSYPLTLDAFSIPGRAMSLILSKIGIQPDWRVLVVTPDNEIGGQFARAALDRCSAQAAEGTIQHLRADGVDEIPDALSEGLPVLGNWGPSPDRMLLLIVAGYPDSNVLEIEEACKRQLRALPELKLPAPNRVNWVITPITEDRLGGVSAKYSISTEAILSDPILLAETSLMRVAGRLAPKPGYAPVVLSCLPDALRYLEGWYIQRVPHDLRQASGTAQQAAADAQPTSAEAALQATFDERAEQALRELEATINASIRTQISEKAEDRKDVRLSSFDGFLNLLAVCGESYRKRTPNPEPFTAQLIREATSRWAALDYAALGFDTTDESAPTPPATGARSDDELRQLIDTMARYTAFMLRLHDSEPPNAAPGDHAPIGPGQQRWWTPSALEDIAPRLIRSLPEAERTKLSPPYLLYAALTVLECVPTALAPFGLALADERSTFAASNVWVGAQQVHFEYERRFGDVRDPHAYTTDDWNRSRRSYRNDNLMAALRAPTHSAFVRSQLGPGERTPQQLLERVTEGARGKEDLQGILTDKLPEAVLFVTRAEHERWSILKAQDGWRYSEDRNDHLHRHKDLKPWDELGADDQIKDLNSILTIDRVVRAMAEGRTI